MNQKANLKVISVSSSRFDTFKWSSVFLFLIAGLYANAYFNQIAWAVRAALGLLLAIGLLLIIFQTAKGRFFWNFVQGARIELRKVVWPTRQETVQTTLIVVAMVVVAAIVLWGIDTLFFWLVGWLTGQRG
ncbi:MAG: preprotein translocase subunit SecE [Coxiellaceae bacterium]|nr:preprotein translocase subunit SecE [Coxiellaceae bacterium]